MGRAGKVSVPALRILTYTLLIKAVLSAVMFACMTADLGLRASALSPQGISAIYMVAQAIDFINIVACMMCLVGILAFSGQFICAQRIMVALLILKCVTIALITAELFLTIGKLETAAAVIDIIMLASVAAERLLTGAAFLFLMKGYGEALRNEGDVREASLVEKIGTYYICVNIAAVITYIVAVSGGWSIIQMVWLILDFMCVTLQFMMYHKAAKVTFHIWKKRAFSDTGGTE